MCAGAAGPARAPVRLAPGRSLVRMATPAPHHHSDGSLDSLPHWLYAEGRAHPFRTQAASRLLSAAGLPVVRSPTPTRLEARHPWRTVPAPAPLAQEYSPSVSPFRTWARGKMFDAPHRSAGGGGRGVVRCCDGIPSSTGTTENFWRTVGGCNAAMARSISS